MFKVCDELDCPLHPENEFRKLSLVKMDKRIEVLSGELLDINTLKAINKAIYNKLELDDIPSNCYLCKYSKRIDIKNKLLAELAIELLK